MSNTGIYNAINNMPYMFRPRKFIATGQGAQAAAVNPIRDAGTEFRRPVTRSAAAPGQSGRQWQQLRSSVTWDFDHANHDAEMDQTAACSYR